jgi:hypothetical protein
MKKKAIKKTSNKVTKPAKGKFKKPEEEEKKGWIHEEEDWKKDELEESEEKIKISVTVSTSDEEDDWIEKDTSLDDDETTKILDEDFLGDEDKDNY